MTYELEFLEEALAEWRRLDGSIKTQFKKRLAERLVEPRISSARLSGHPDRYKIKLRHLGYRLVYEVHDERVMILVIAVGKRDKSMVYKAAENR